MIMKYCDASINLEIATGQFNQAKQKLIAELNKKPEAKNE